MTYWELYWLLLDCKTIVDAVGVKATSTQLGKAIAEMDKDFFKKERPPSRLIAQAINVELEYESDSTVERIDVTRIDDEGRQGGVI